MRQVSFAALAVAASILATLPAAAEPVVETPPLYLLPKEPGAIMGNFTLTAPSNGTAVVQESESPFHDRVYWHWGFGPTPRDWSLRAGDVIQLNVELDHLDALLPIADPRTHPDAVGKIKAILDVQIGHSSAQEAPPPGTQAPSLAPNATGVAFLESPLMGGAVRQSLTIDAVVQEDQPANASLDLVVRLTLTGRADPRDRPHVLLGGSDAPSHILLPGFPFAEFAAWEEADRARRACLERVLLRLPCENETAAAPVPAPVQEAPSWTFAPLVAIGLMAVALIRRR